MTPTTLETFAGLLRTRSGLVVGADKDYLLQSRLAPILKEHGLRDLDALAARLRAPGSEKIADAIVEAMTTNETLFFRDGTPFAHLRSHALPRLHAARAPGAALRIWSAAASSGQEAYSIGITTLELAELRNRAVEIVGTDIAREPLARAREGLYSQFEMQRGVPMQMLVKYFRKDAVGWRIDQKLRAMVQFREWNLLGDLRPLGQFDIVFCRNVLIYFDQPTKARVLAAIARQIAPDGVLYLGGAETVLGVSDRFVAVPGERGAYAPTAADTQPARAPALAR